MSFVRQPLRKTWGGHFCARLKHGQGRPLRTTEELAAAYQPQQVEPKWQVDKVNVAGNCKRGPFRMILPPPNVTGDLHLGHALMAITQDVICRQRRQLGYNVEWIPGTDHAGIATQVVVEKKLLKERQTNRHQLGREEFLKEIWRWKQDKGDGIVADLQKLGCTLSWDKEYFTMDERQSSAVSTAFVRLFDEGLIRRQQSLVNWSCSLESAISDIEVDSLEVNGPTEVAVPGYHKNVTFGRLYDIAYRVVCDTNKNVDEHIVVSTTRPETLLGDVAVAVHPEDIRYLKYRDRGDVKLWHPFRQEAIPLIFDMTVDREFGTGAVKITPAHDRKDFDVGERHLLKPLPVFSERGNILQQFEGFSDMPRFAARDLILEQLATMGLLHATRDHNMQLPICSRSKDVIEYMMRPQWFLHCQPMADAALSEVRSGRVQIVPPNFEVDWQRWLEDCHDWCISRQLWWGHRIPAYQARATADPTATCWVAAHNEQEAREKAAKILETEEFSLEQDPDVLDTWFSSALLPFSVFNWPADEYKQHYPLDLMETGHDILFFWVARMAMLGLKLTGEMPFKKILLNGIVCDAHGRKMSKSLGNVVTPQQVVQGATLESLKAEVQRTHDSGLLSDAELRKSLKGLQKMFPHGIQECGTDALRFTLCSHNIKNHFINFNVHECHTNKLFLNKIWQATRYTLGAAEHLRMPLHEIETMNTVPLGDWDRWILSRLADTMKTCAYSMDTYNLHTATAALKQFFYTNLCDVYVETTKSSINASDDSGYLSCATLATCLSWGLQALWPFAPYVAQELLQHVPHSIELDLDKFHDIEVERDITEVLNICMSVRQLKSRSKISRKHSPLVFIFATSIDAFKFLKPHLRQIQLLTQADEVHLLLEPNGEQQVVAHGRLKDEFECFSTAGHLCSFGIKTNGRYQQANAHTRKLNEQKLQKLCEQLDRYRLRWDDAGFRKSASIDVQLKHRRKIEKLEAEIKNIIALASKI